MDAGATTTMSAADLNGDGKEECLFGLGNRLYAVGTRPDGKVGKIRWSLSFPNRKTSWTASVQTSAGWQLFRVKATEN